MPKKAKKKTQKKSSQEKKSPLLRIITLFVILTAAYYSYNIISIKDLSEESIALEELINERLVSSGVSFSHVLEKFQIEKRDKGMKWILFSKKIETSASTLSGIMDDLESDLNDKGFTLLEKADTAGGKTFKAGFEGLEMNRILFMTVEDRPLIAVIVDDVGYTKNIRAFMELDIPLTYSIMPGLPYSEFLAEEFANSGIDYMLHLPMEPEGYPETDPGENALLTGMSEKEIAGLVDKALKSVPGAAGLNNHMGSRFTSDPKSMEKLMRVLKARGLFFVDSATSPDTAGYKTAKKAGIPAAINNIFLDNQTDYAYISVRMDKLKETVLKRKETVAICHMTRKNTPGALEDFIADIGRDNVRFVPVKELLK